MGYALLRDSIYINKSIHFFIYLYSNLYFVFYINLITHSLECFIFKQYKITV